MSDHDIMYSFVSMVVVRKTKSATTAHLTIPAPLREAIGLKGGEMLEVALKQIIRKEDFGKKRAFE